MLAVAEKEKVVTTLDTTAEPLTLEKVKALIAEELPSLIADALKQNRTADHQPTPARTQMPPHTDQPTPTDTPADELLTPSKDADQPTPTDTPSRLPLVQTLPDGSTEAKLDFMYREMILRFEAMNQRFADLMHYSDRRFEEMQKHADKRFEEMQKNTDKRFEEMQKNTDRRFADLMHYVDKRFSSLQWFMGVGMTLLAVLITIYRFLGNGN